MIVSLPDVSPFAEVAMVEVLAMMLAAEVWLLIGGLKKRGGKHAS